MDKNEKIVDSDAVSLKILFSDKYTIDYYQREYIWQREQIEDLINDLSNEFIKNWNPNDTLESCKSYDPYYMGEIILSVSNNGNNIIDGQQRITTLSLLLIYMMNKFNHIKDFPTDPLKSLVYSIDYGIQKFNLDIEERNECMKSLLNNGMYEIKDGDSTSVRNIIERYIDIEYCWDQRINKENIAIFGYWVIEKIIFSKVWTNNAEFAYLIFETMNDRGVSLTSVEMLRSYLLTSISVDKRDDYIDKFDSALRELDSIKTRRKLKNESEFFKIYLRGHYAENLSQVKESNSDFQRIGREFHRWVFDNANLLNLKSSEDYEIFIDKINYFAKKYRKIMDLIAERNTKNNLYLIVNNDYKFTLQPALILSSIKYDDKEETVNKKIKLISKYLTKVLSWKVWNQDFISQSRLEAPIYDLCKKIRDKSYSEIENILNSEPIVLEKLRDDPTMNNSNKNYFKVLISLITEIVADGCGEPDYMLNKDKIEVEHIWSNHFDRHEDEFDSEADFQTIRNRIGGLLVLPKSFNESYGDMPYEDKVKYYIEQNYLAQTLCKSRYERNPSFKKFLKESKLDFKHYEHFKKSSIEERTELYKKILEWNWQ